MERMKGWAQEYQAQAMPPGIEVLEQIDTRCSLPGRPESWVDASTAHATSTSQLAWSSSPMDVAQQGPIYQPAGFAPSHHTYNKRTNLTSAPSQSPWCTDAVGTSIHGSGAPLLGRKPSKQSVKHMLAGTSGQVAGSGSLQMGPAGSIYHCHRDVNQSGLTAYELYEAHLKTPIHCPRAPMAQANHQLLPPHPVTHPCDPAGTKAWGRDSGALLRTVRTDCAITCEDPSFPCTSNTQYADPRSLHYLTRTAPSNRNHLIGPKQHIYREGLADIENLRAAIESGDSAATIAAQRKMNPSHDPWADKMQQIVESNSRDHELTLEAAKTTELLPYRASCPGSRGVRDQGAAACGTFHSLDRAPTAADRQLCKDLGFQPTSDRRMTALQTEFENFITEAEEMFSCH